MKLAGIASPAILAEDSVLQATVILIAGARDCNRKYG
jgi:hypothetical protein